MSSSENVPLSKARPSDARDDRLNETLALGQRLMPLLAQFLNCFAGFPQVFRVLGISLRHAGGFTRAASSDIRNRVSYRTRW